MQLTSTYAPVIAGHNVGHVFLEMNQRYISSEWLRPIQIFRVRNRCCWARRRIILVGTPKPWCKSRPGVIISKGTAICICSSLTPFSQRFFHLRSHSRISSSFHRHRQFLTEAKRMMAQNLSCLQDTHPSLRTETKVPRQDILIHGLWRSLPATSGGW